MLPPHLNGIGQRGMPRLVIHHASILFFLLVRRSKFLSGKGESRVQQCSPARDNSPTSHEPSVERGATKKSNENESQPEFQVLLRLGPLALAQEFLQSDDDGLHHNKAEGGGESYFGPPTPHSASKTEGTKQSERHLLVVVILDLGHRREPSGAGC